MWMLKNRTAYAAERNWVRDKDGIHWWLVAVKATFAIGPGGQLSLADQQPPPVLSPEYFGKPGQSSLRQDSDLLGLKPGTDVLVLAHAHAPGGQPASVVEVALRCGRLAKELLVYGERTYERGWFGTTLTRPRKFLVHPIRYEFAFGGSDCSDPSPRKHCMDERNPIGRGFALQTAAAEGQLAHSIEYTQGSATDRGPAGLGPIDSSWLPRRRLAGTYDAHWEQSKKPLLPDDFDPAFAQSAPTDQQSHSPLVGGERVELQNLTPDGLLRFALPAISLQLTTHFGRRREQHGARLSLILVDTEPRLLTLVWQSGLRVAAFDTDYLDYTEIVETRETM